LALCMGSRSSVENDIARAKRLEWGLDSASSLPLLTRLCVAMLAFAWPGSMRHKRCKEERERKTWFQQWRVCTTFLMHWSKLLRSYRIQRDALGHQKTLSRIGAARELSAWVRVKFRSSANSDKKKMLVDVNDSDSHLKQKPNEMDAGHSWPHSRQCPETWNDRDSHSSTTFDSSGLIPGAVHAHQEVCSQFDNVRPGDIGSSPVSPALVSPQSCIPTEERGSAKRALLLKLKEERKSWIESGLWPDRVIYHEWGLIRTFIAVVVRDHPITSLLCCWAKQRREPLRMGVLLLLAQTSVATVVAVELQVLGFHDHLHFAGAALAAKFLRCFVAMYLERQKLPLSNLQLRKLWGGENQIPASLYTIRKQWQCQRFIGSCAASILLLSSIIGAMVVVRATCSYTDLECIKQFTWTWVWTMVHVLAVLPLVLALVLTGCIRWSVYSRRLDGFFLLFPGVADFRTVQKGFNPVRRVVPSAEKRHDKFSAQESGGAAENNFRPALPWNKSPGCAESKDIPLTSLLPTPK